MLDLPGFDYRPDFLESSLADELLSCLWLEVPWRSQTIKIYGREVLQPRLIAWYADPGVSYTYSGLTLTAEPWHEQVNQLRQTLVHRTGRQYNSVLLNAYRDGQDSMGWHADNEPELGPYPSIASVSLGQTRRMRVRKGNKGSSQAIDLEHGSLLLMEQESQLHYQHCIPKTRRVPGLRINLTFRQIL